ncbi:MAG: hypothetical protein HWQ43_02550 [Nostoc sp. JL31]|nr:hypothetical protein [Nostoc sp. JL31]
MQIKTSILKQKSSQSLELLTGFFYKEILEKVSQKLNSLLLTKANLDKIHILQEEILHGRTGT